MSDNQTPNIKTYPCPQCGKPTVWQDNPSKPFCSERCKLIDLGAWASEDYKIASVETPFSDEMNNAH
ncbi:MULTISPECIES: DNA gyrase inhibitor YacG [unclassified Moraxella]|uniref:DNA gyrase inhibitor YacG n=1 Tax=unclassified Moraxella TaxID=2685852 RepID=UPI003AF99761